MDKNQTLLIRFTALEDEGYYVCNASNRIGSAVSTNTLTLIGMFIIFKIHVLINNLNNLSLL